MLFGNRSWLSFLTLAALLGASSFARADKFPPDPVEELRQTLKASIDDLARRDPALARRLASVKLEDQSRVFAEEKDKLVAQRVEALKTIGELRRALLLQDWKLEAGSTDEGNPERRSRALVTNRFREQVREALEHGSPVTKVATMNLLAETGFNTSTADDRAGITRFFAPELANLIKTAKEPAIRVTAARTLGLIFPDPAVAGPALAELLKNGNVEERRAAAGALANLTKVVSQLTASGSSTTRVQASLKDIIAANKAIAPLAGRALGDSDLEVRRLAAEALYQACAALSSQAPQPHAGEDSYSTNPKDLFDPERAELPTLLKALGDELPALTRAAGDSDADVRISARNAIREWTSASQRLPLSKEAPPPLRDARGGAFHAETALVSRTEEAGQPQGESMDKRLRSAVPVLAAGVSDPDVPSRLAAIHALEVLGTDGAGAVPALIKALNDKNVFVRWSAARTLGRIGSPDADPAVPGLAKLVADPDIDVALASATAIDRLGPAARHAVEALIRACRASDAELRIAAMRSLEGIGSGSAPAIPVLIQNLIDPDARVRRMAARVIGRFGPQAASAEPALRQAMNDRDPEVRQAASEAILSVLRGK
jgi:HEAT repeat protein